MGQTVTPKQRKAIECLLQQTSISAAAEAAGCARRSIYRWLRDDAFVAELNAAEDASYSELRRTLAAGKSTALKTLLELMTYGKSESVKKAAAADWLSFYFKMHELNLLSRVERLEDRVYGKS